MDITEIEQNLLMSVLEQVTNQISAMLRSPLPSSSRPLMSTTLTPSTCRILIVIFIGNLLWHSKTVRLSLPSVNNQPSPDCSILHTQKRPSKENWLNFCNSSCRTTYTCHTPTSPKEPRRCENEEWIKTLEDEQEGEIRLPRTAEGWGIYHRAD